MPQIRAILARILLAELLESPMPDIWLLRAARFWHDLAIRLRLHERVALDAVQLALRLCGRLEAVLQNVGYNMVLTLGSLFNDQLILQYDTAQAFAADP